MPPVLVVSTRSARYGYLTALAGSLMGAVTGALTAAFLTAIVFGLTGLFAAQTMVFWPLAAAVPLGAALGCTLALRRGGYQGAGATGLLLLALIAAVGVAQLAWRPVDMELGAATLWALRSVLLPVLALLTCGARGFYLVFRFQREINPRVQKVNSGEWVTQRK